MSRWGGSGGGGIKELCAGACSLFFSRERGRKEEAEL
jgi:hypothetical protein